jgi:hypothetical protein
VLVVVVVVVVVVDNVNAHLESFNVDTGRFGVVVVGELTTHIASIHEEWHGIVIGTLNGMISIQFVIEFRILCCASCESAAHSNVNRGRC